MLWSRNLVFVGVFSMQPPTVVCSICKRDGHLKDDCPEDFKKIELNPLPPMTERFREILDGLCMLCYRECQTILHHHLYLISNAPVDLVHLCWRFKCDLFVFADELSPTLGEQQKREQILASLEHFIRKEYNGANAYAYESTTGYHKKKTCSSKIVLLTKIKWTLFTFSGFSEAEVVIIV